MVKKLLKEKDGKIFLKDIKILKNPEKLKAVLHPTRWVILNELSKNEMYPSNIAKKLGIHEQKIYYHINILKRAGLIEIVKKEEKKGALARYFKTIYPSLGVELPFGERSISSLALHNIDERLKKFYYPFIRDNEFNAFIVVGSPDAHGPFKASAKDTHYAAYLGIFLGQFAELPDYNIKLDVDVKIQKEEKSNLILIGGPGTNLITSEINKNLKIKFNERNYWVDLISKKTGKKYTSENCGIIAKISNPWEKGNSILILAGLGKGGTKSAVLAVTKFWEKTLKDYKGGNLIKVVQGYDLDGDGKIDSIEILE